MKILWHSNAPFVPTGYGSQTGIWTSLIRDLGHDVAISSFWGLQGKALDWDGMTVYPADDEWGNKWLPAFAAHHGEGDVRSVQVITLMDVWVLVAPILSTLRMASWVPVDHEPAPPRVVDFFKRSGSVPIAMSRFGERMLSDAGLEPLYVPHGIDTQILAPVDRAKVRAAMEIPEDAFVVGMVAANKGNAPPRKAFPQAFEAFAELHRRHPNAILYLHTTKQGGATGLDLVTLAEVCGVPLDAVRWTPEFELVMGVEYAKMSWVYSNMDVLLAPSYGEGFGIPIVEAQACGVPVIVNDFSAMSELAGPGWKIGGERWYDASQGAWYQSPSVRDCVDALEAAFSEASSRRDACREFAVQYDTRRVLDEFWVPTLGELERRELALRVALPTEDGLNRAQRRAAGRKKSAAA